MATGVPVATVGGAQRIEGLLTTLPLTVVGSLAGALGYGFLIGAPGIAYAGGLLAMAISVLVVTGMVWLAGVLVRPWLDAAVEPGNLRTE